MATRALCIHGHFYQPPREDPITGRIPPEPGAAPHNNWNERIHAECYRPNAEMGNFERISFNIGPTLCAWMQQHDPATCRLIAAQDRANFLRYGVGNALAQPYNHTILPLASYADKVTQVYWGIADFKRNLGRLPQGMWLPETAVDTETLIVLADQGIQFTILAPWQSRSESIDPTEPYKVALPGGRSITVFFYHQALSTGVSFNPSLTTNSDLFVHRSLATEYNPDKNRNGEAQLILIASDGELYGHHQPFRDHFLEHLVNGATSSADIKITYPALWLVDNPPRRWTSIRELTSWSCFHGLDRWGKGCSCTPGEGLWKFYLRQAFDWLAAEIDAIYTEIATEMGLDPWRLLNHYIHVLCGDLSIDELISSVSERVLTGEQVKRLGTMLAAQREKHRMFTSCGWFFDDFDRIEPRNNLAYAAQAVRLTHLATGVDLAPQMQARLESVTSQRSGLRGDKVFAQQLNQAIRFEYNHLV